MKRATTAEVFEVWVEDSGKWTPYTLRPFTSREDAEAWVKKYLTPSPRIEVRERIEGSA